MKQIKNHNHPFLFKEKNSVKILTSKFLNQTYKIKYGSVITEENIWKLSIVDYVTLEENELITTDKFLIDNQELTVISETNGFVFKKEDSYKISYIVKLHNGRDDTPLLLRVICGDLDLKTFKVSNIEVNNKVNFIRSAYVSDPYVVSNYYDFILIDNTADENEISSENLRPYFNFVYGILGVWDNTNNIIVSGIIPNVSEEYRSYLYNKDLKKFSPIIYNSRSLIYKCSMLDNDNQRLLAWTDKNFKNINASDYFLNIDEISLS
jgi:hypothetical protein